MAIQQIMIGSSEVGRITFEARTGTESLDEWGHGSNVGMAFDLRDRQIEPVLEDRSNGQRIYRFSGTGGYFITQRYGQSKRSSSKPNLLPYQTAHKRNGSVMIGSVRFDSVLNRFGPDRG
jgi:hypothetical protein